MIKELVCSYHRIVRITEFQTQNSNFLEKFFTQKIGVIFSKTKFEFFREILYSKDWSYILYTNTACLVLASTVTGAIPRTSRHLNVAIVN
jgi:hypothetical protein